MEDMRRNYDALKSVLLVIFNNVLALGVIPTECQLAIVKLIYKGGQRNSGRNDGTISIISSFSLTLEKFILRVMTKFVGKFNILSQNKYAFTPSRGTGLLLEEFADEFYSASIHNKVSRVLFVPAKHLILSVTMYYWKSCIKSSSVVLSFVY